MSIKSDHWIRRQAQTAGMIEPFEANQVKLNGEQKIISYGTSSYGYDIRCANEFKIFTNINSTIVDPKNFDPKNFVEINADYCIIPSSPSALDTNALVSAAECALLVGKPYRFLASRIVKNTMMTKDLLKNLSETGESFETKITNSVNMTGAVSRGSWVGSYMPGCDNHLQFKALAEELILCAQIKKNANQLVGV